MTEQNETTIPDTPYDEFEEMSFTGVLGNGDPTDPTQGIGNTTIEATASGKRYRVFTFPVQHNEDRLGFSPIELKLFHPAEWYERGFNIKNLPDNERQRYRIAQEQLTKAFTAVGLTVAKNPIDRTYQRPDMIELVGKEVGVKLKADFQDPTKPALKSFFSANGHSE